MRSRWKPWGGGSRWRGSPARTWPGGDTAPMDRSTRRLGPVGCWRPTSAWRPGRVWPTTRASTRRGGGGGDWGLLRVASRGQLGGALGSGGKRVTGFHDTPSYLRAVAITADDKILFAGGADQGWAMEGPAMVVGRVTESGALDS